MPPGWDANIVYLTPPERSAGYTGTPVGERASLSLQVAPSVACVHDTSTLRDRNGTSAKDRPDTKTLLL